MRSGTNAIQATQFELSKMLHQAYQQGSEHGYHLELADATEKLTTQFEDRLSEAFNDFSDRLQESNDNAFGEGYSAGIREEQERWERAQAPKISVATQTIQSTASISIQTYVLIISQSSSATISTQTKPPTISDHESIPILIPIPNSEPLIPATTNSSSTFNWPDDAISLPTIPLIPPKIPRDLSCLRSSTKNPFSSLRPSRHHSELQKTFSSC
jgi:hypothetical protein